MRRSQATFNSNCAPSRKGHDTENKFVVKEARLHTAIYSPLRLLKGPREVIGEVPQEAALNLSKLLQLCKAADMDHECS